VLVPAQALYRRHRRQVLADPTDGLDLPEAGGRRERVASPAQAAALLDALPEDHRALWATAFYGGLRRGELRALRVADVGADSIGVERGWDDYQGPIDPKSKAGVRSVPLPETLRVILAEHVDQTGRRGDDLLVGRYAPRPIHAKLRARQGRRGLGAARSRDVARVSSLVFDLPRRGLRLRDAR
jgi:integrase